MRLSRKTIQEHMATDILYMKAWSLKWPDVLKMVLSSMPEHIQLNSSSKTLHLDLPAKKKKVAEENQALLKIGKLFEMSFEEKALAWKEQEKN
jgi:hypothetical protein